MANKSFVINMIVIGVSKRTIQNFGIVGVDLGCCTGA
jgi:hypothetical protein